MLVIVCQATAKDIKHRLGFLLPKPEAPCDQNSTYNKKDKNGAAQRLCYEEIKKWSETLEKLLSNRYGLAAFTEFLQSEYSEENIEFWLACEDYKKVKSPVKLAAKARKIYDEYIATQSPKEVNLESLTMEETKKNILKPTPSCFNEAQSKIYSLMQKDSYPRFLKSKIYLDLISQASSNSPRSHA
uniref:Regulator of G protein signaling 4 n=1 Tax=Callorhinchus milii TaxID=7868 RepID=A0A4W3K380_CALMI